jgi:hypothetical protein
MILRPSPTLSTDDFSFTNRTFTAEDSTLFGPLNGKDGRVNARRLFVASQQFTTHHFGLVYDDACDWGFTMVNPATGKEVVFAHHRTDEVEDEVSGWWFVCVTPGHKDLKCLIIND